MFKLQMQKLYIFLSLICWARSDTTNSCLHFNKLNIKEAFVDLFNPRIHVTLMFYTRDTITCGEHLFSRNLILNKKFNGINKTVWIIHGYRPFGSYPPWLEKLTKVLLSLEDMNIIIVDWNRGATTLLYHKAVKRTWKVAQLLRRYIIRMMGLGISLQSFHFIGVSLGAHISGYVGNFFGGQIGRITGIDPAGPAFNYMSAKVRLDHTDAQFVDVIHSDAGGLGISHSIGHIDFYPNGGEKQPGCSRTIFSGVSSFIKCSHQRAVFLFISSLSAKCNMTAFPCDSYEAYKKGHCTDCEDSGLNLCPISGYFIDHWKKEIVNMPHPGLKAYFNTSPKEPFCLFHYSLDIETIRGINVKSIIEVKLKDINGFVEVSKIKSVPRTFPAFSEIHVVAGFYNDFKEISQIIVKYIPKSFFLKCFKCSYYIPRIRLRSLNFHERRALCSEDVILIEDHEIELNPHFCDE